MKKLLLCLLAVVLLSSFSPVFTEQGKKVLFELENLDSSKVSLKVVDSKGRTLFEEVFTSQQLKKVFNFEDALPDTYYILAVDGGETYKKVVKID